MSDFGKVIVFDLDDTLYQEIEFVKSAFAYISKRMDPKVSKLLFTEMFSRFRNNLDVFDLLSERYNIPLEKILSWYRFHFPNLEVNKDVMLTLQFLSKTNHLGIITDGRSKTQRNKISSLGIVEYFSEIIISEEIGEEKPNPKAFEIIEKKFPDSEYWYIGDNLKKDFVAPNVKGWVTVYKEDSGTNIHPNAHNFCDNLKNIDYVITDVKELKKIIV